MAPAPSQSLEQEVRMTLVPKRMLPLRERLGLRTVLPEMAQFLSKILTLMEVRLTTVVRRMVQVPMMTLLRSLKSLLDSQSL
ncbi:uncharacterized protein LTR77_008539 [Saxophila tyrrhenica]|uniref:Uncharacterized protein n=1 Tax=Saxophila tyrrhenica TaxID=1690608 RepID=A0AAV9P559_9PEZI|nr:hypothetical protein LTR77_008539 [Saxophila tyrrhenica]